MHKQCNFVITSNICQYMPVYCSLHLHINMYTWGPVAMMLPHVTISRSPVASIWPHSLLVLKTMQNNVKLQSTITYLLLLAIYCCNITRFAKKTVYSLARFSDSLNTATPTTFETIFANFLPFTPNEHAHWLTTSGKKIK